MTEARETLVREGFELLSAGGPDGVVDLIADDFVMVTPADLASEPDTYRGISGLRRWWDSFSDVMSSIRIEANEIIDPGEGEEILAALVMTVRGRATGIETTQEAYALCTLADSKLVRIRFFASRDAALSEISR